MIQCITFDFFSDFLFYFGIYFTCIMYFHSDSGNGYTQDFAQLHLSDSLVSDDAKNRVHLGIHGRPHMAALGLLHGHFCKL